MRRELAEELGIEAEIGPEIARYWFRYAGRPRILLIFFNVDTFQGELANKVFEQIRWAPAQTLRGYDLLEADFQVLDKILEQV